MRVLITGVNGFIGRHLCELLLQHKYQIRGLVLPQENYTTLQAMPVEIWKGNLADPSSLRGIAEGCSMVFHLAARVTDWGTYRQFHESIIVATENILKETIAAQVPRFVFASSVAACGMGRHLGFPNENTPIQKSGIPYNDTKLLAETLVKTQAQTFGFDYTIIRPTNVTGPNSVWVKDPVARMKSTFGLPLLDGGQYDACLVDVANLVDGFYRAATMPEGINETFFLMDDWKVSWKQYLTDLGNLANTRPRGTMSFATAWQLGSLSERIANLLKVRSPVTRLGAGLIGRDCRVDTTKAQTKLGWSSQVNYQEAMRRISAWLEAEKNDAASKK